MVNKCFSVMAIFVFIFTGTAVFGETGPVSGNYDVIKAIPLPNSVANFNAKKINDAGTIAGVTEQGVYLLKNGAYTLVPMPDPALVNPQVYDLKDNDGVLCSAYNQTTREVVLWLFENGAVKVIPSYNGYKVFTPQEMNENGQIIGNSYDENSNNILWTWKDGVYTVLDRLPDAITMRMVGINKLGHIFGTAYYSSGSISWILIDGVYEIIAPPAGTDEFAIGDVNNKGQIIGMSSGGGYRFWLLDNGTYTEIVLPEQDGRANPTEINDNGVIAGVGYYPDRTNWAWVWENGTFKHLSASASDTNIYTTDINNNGYIVGSNNPATYVHTPYLWKTVTSQTPGNMEDLKKLIANKNNPYLNLNDFDFSNGIIVDGNLVYVDMENANLAYSSIANANLSGMDLSGTNFAYVDFTGSDLAGADFTGASLAYADFTGADLTGTDFTGANLSGAIMPDGTVHP